MNWLRRFRDRWLGILPPPDPRCVVYNWQLWWRR